MKMMFMGKERVVTQAYNGKQGCQCGCRGDYVTVDDKPIALQRRIRKIESFIGPLRPDAANYGDNASYSDQPFGDVCYAYVNEGDRTTCVYFKP